jgi:hypothetical protein
LRLYEDHRSGGTTEEASRMQSTAKGAAHFSRAH